jgi:uncharacterized protein DUF4406
MKPMLIYVAGPMTHNFIGGLIDAIDVGAKLIEMGHVPYMPQLSMLVDVRKSHSADLVPGTRLYEAWMKFDFRVIDMADAVYKLPGMSTGADREVAYCEQLGKPVYYSLDQVPQ